jgi:outer membrane protein assembly factor BamA
MSGSYTFNDQARNPGGNSLRLRLNGEINGNLLDLISRIANGKREASDTMKLFGIKYSQYARTDASASYKFALGPKTALVYRLYAGVAAPYGNSTLPFDRLFYAGGPNSMRGWTPRTLGPGNSAESVDNTYPSQLGTIKLETNLEFRFPVYDFLYGAVFCDVGNVWLADTADADPAAVFHFDKFYRQLGFNTGLGARFDLSYFLIRVDWGIRMYNPNKAPDTRWISDLTLRQTTFNIAVDYPF